MTIELFYRSEYFQVTLEPEYELLHVVRSAVPLSTGAAAGREYAALADCIVQRPARRLLFDVRLAPGTNAPDFEACIQPHVNRLLAATKRWAFLARTAVGKLQIQRLAREQGNRLRRSFDDEEAARRYLLGSPLGS